METSPVSLFLSLPAGNGICDLCSKIPFQDLAWARVSNQLLPEFGNAMLFNKVVLLFPFGYCFYAYTPSVSSLEGRR